MQLRNLPINTRTYMERTTRFDQLGSNLVFLRGPGECDQKDKVRNLSRNVLIPTRTRYEGRRGGVAVISYDKRGWQLQYDHT